MATSYIDFISYRFFSLILSVNVVAFVFLSQANVWNYLFRHFRLDFSAVYYFNSKVTHAKSQTSTYFSFPSRMYTRKRMRRPFSLPFSIQYENAK